MFEHIIPESVSNKWLKEMPFVMFLVLFWHSLLPTYLFSLDECTKWPSSRLAGLSDLAANRVGFRLRYQQGETDKEVNRKCITSSNLFWNNKKGIPYLLKVNKAHKQLLGIHNRKYTIGKTLTTNLVTRAITTKVYAFCVPTPVSQPSQSLNT